MKLLSSFTLLFVTILCHAGEPSFAKTEKYICLDRIILQFNEEVSEEQQAAFFERLRLGDLAKIIRLEYPRVVIAKLNAPAESYPQLKQLMQRLQWEPGIAWVNPVLRNNGDEVSVLQEVFVKAADAEQESRLRGFAKQFRCAIKGTYTYDERVFILTPGRNIALNSLELACKLADLEAFEYAHPNFLFSPVVGTNDPFFNRQWNLLNTGSAQQGSGTAGADMSIEEAWAITKGDSSIKIAILDSGVDTLHPDLAPNLLPGYDANGGGSNGYPNKNFSSDGHGTACAGIAAAVSDNGAGLAGVAPGCKIIPVKVFYYVDTVLGLTFNPPIPYTTSLWIADAINWAHVTGKADIMSNSWGIPDFLFGLLQQPISLVEDAILDAHINGRNGKGIPQLFSTGNDNANKPLWPSRLPVAIAVTATSMCDERKSPTSCDNEDWGGNYGEGTDVAAPGVKMPATDIVGSKGFSSGSYTADFNGTSAACPNAAGVMALILSVKPDLKAWDATYILANSADRVGGYDYSANRDFGSWSQELGYGRVNAYNALQLTMIYTGVKDAAPQENRFAVYPNPLAAGQFTVNLTLQKNADVTISLIDVNGKIINRRTAAFQSGRHTVLHDAPPAPGIYFVEIRADQTTRHLKLLFSGNQ